MRQLPPKTSQVLGPSPSQIPGHDRGGLKNLEAREFLVLEDAPAGIQAAHAAGMKCLALAHTRPLEALGAADWACRGFAEVRLPDIETGFRS